MDGMDKDGLDPKLSEAEARGRFAKELSDDAMRISQKLERARLAMQEDADIRQRLRSDLDAARNRGRELAERLDKAEATLKIREGELELAQQAETEAKVRFQEFKTDIATRDQKIAELEDRVSELSHQYAEAAHLVSLSRDRATTKENELYRAHEENGKLKADLEVFKTKAQENFDRAEKLDAELLAARVRLSLQEEALGNFAKRFDEAAEIYEATLAVLGDQRDEKADIHDELVEQIQDMRKRLFEAEARSEKLAGQVSELRTENAGLRAEHEVNVAELEKARDDALSEIGVLRRRLHDIMPVKVVNRAQSSQAKMIDAEVIADDSLAS